MKDLKAAAKEINEILKPEPLVATKVGVKKSDLTNELLELSEEIEESDGFSDETLDTLESIGAEFDWRNNGDEPDEVEDEAEEEPDEVEEEAEEEAEEEPEEVEEEPEEEKKPKAKKGAKTDKKPKAGAKPKAEAAKAKKEPKKDKKPRYSRGAALIDALKKGGDREELITLIDDFYEKNGGQRNANGAKVMLDIHLPVLNLAGVLEEKNGKFKLIK